MVHSDSTSGDPEGTARGVNRRTVLQGLGTGMVASVGLVGTAGGTDVEGKPVFCGCSQVCVCVEGEADVLMAVENDDGGFDVGFIVGDGELHPYPDGDPQYSDNFCVSTDDEGVPDGKIIGLQTAETRWVNPHQCAQKALDAEREQLASTHVRPAGVTGGPCGKPPCEHPSNGKNGREEMGNGNGRNATGTKEKGGNKKNGNANPGNEKHSTGNPSNDKGVNGNSGDDKTGSKGRGKKHSNDKGSNDKTGNSKGSNGNRGNGKGPKRNNGNGKRGKGNNGNGKGR